ncbi:MAG: signal peptidase I [Planctomycetaceae bacterium]
MSKSVGGTSSGSSPAGSSPAGSSPSGSSPSGVPPVREENWRETAESVVIAFILAFLFRTFEAEAFVIPTGSMAPTLYGAHRDITCEQCGHRFAVGASTPPAQDSEIRNGGIDRDRRMHSAICPNAACQFANNVLDREIFAGDRILVNKFPYDHREPSRWDVVVFKCPETAKINYIKRLVGLPGEEIQIRRGDVWYRHLDSDAPWQIARKPIEKQNEIQILVYDNDLPAKALLQRGWPESWSGQPGTQWEGDTERRSFRIDPAGEGRTQTQWLRYTHYLPRPQDWQPADGGPLSQRPEPQLIRDVYGYNMRITNDQAEASVRRREPLSLGFRDLASNWVSDLSLSCELHPEGESGEVILEIVEGQRHYRCRLNLATGQGQMEHPSEMSPTGDETDLVLVGAPFESGLTPGRTHQVQFTNFDDRLVLLVDGKVRQLVELNLAPDAQYPALPPNDLRDTPDDRSPIGIGSRGVSLRVAKLKIHRDIYYTEDNAQGRADPLFRLVNSEDNSRDEFLMLGDNSPRSHDSRLWRNSHAVPRQLLIGKAFCIYWPHAMPFLNGGRGFPVSSYREQGDPKAATIPRFSLPFYPQFGRMKRIW